MSSRPSHARPDGHAYLSLQNEARRSRRSTQDLLRLYALEGFLARLAASPHANQLVLKGGVLLAAYGLRRPTRDIDLQARQISNDIATVLNLARAIAMIDVMDGLVFEGESATAETIRDDDDYQGVRISLTASLATARISLHIDVNVGDPITPHPEVVVLPGLVGRSVELLGYPLSMVHAEKLVTAIDRGVTNTRWRDFADVFMLSGHHQANAVELRASMESVAGYRNVALRELSGILADWPDQAQPRWAVWLRKQHMPSDIPPQFGDVVAAVCAFADPVLMGNTRGTTWDPAQRVWR